MALVIQPIGDAFAGEVTGVDCRKPLSPKEVAAIEAGMDQYAVLVYRGQSLTDQEQLAFTLHFGDIEKKGRGSGTGHIHFRSDDQARPLARGIGDFSNVDGRGQPLPPDSRAYQFKLADRLWHSDSSFKPTPAKYSILHAHAIPTKGGNTEFADMRAAYDALDDETKIEVEDLVCEHSQLFSRGKIGFTDFTEEERDRFSPVRQVLVRRHPVTGRKSLYLSSHAGGIIGWPVPEARIFLQDLAEHATQRQFVHSHVWRVGDLVIWDNRQVMHRARPFPHAEPRDMRRTTLAGDGLTTAQQ